MKLLQQCPCCKGEGYIPAMTQERVEPCPICDTEGCVDIQPTKQHMLCPICDGGGEISTLPSGAWVGFVFMLLVISVLGAAIVCYNLEK